MIQTIRDMFGQIGEKGTALINKLTSDPMAVMNALRQGVTSAMTEYFGNWKQNLVEPFLKWLGDGINLTGLNLSSLTGEGVVPFLLQYSGLTWDNIQNIALKELGEGNVAAVKRLADTIFAELNMAEPNSVLTFVQRFTNPQGELAQYIETIDLEALKDDALKTLAAKAGVALAGAVPQLLAKFVPGAGNLLAAYQAIQGGLNWLLQNQAQLQGLFDNLIQAVDHLITPNAAGVKAAVLSAMTGNAPILMLDLAANQLGLGKVRNQIKDALQFVPKKVEGVIRKTVRKLANALNAGLNPVYNGRLQDIKTFGLAQQNYAIFAARDSQDIKIKIVSQNGLLHKLEVALTAKDLSTAEAKAHLADYVSKAKALAAAAKGKPRGKPVPAAEANRMADLKAKQAAVDAARDVLILDLLDWDSYKLGGCFATGTKILTREGWKAVEQLAVGDQVASRTELDPRAPIEFKEVEQTFQRTGRVLHLHLESGRLIRTTPEHPFWIEDEGWVAAGVLLAGDRLVTHGGEWAIVQEVFDTGEYETVYNCRVADHHTYFALGDGADEARQADAVWAHNVYDFVSGRKVAEEVNAQLPTAKKLSAANLDKIIDYIAHPELKSEYGRVAQHAELVDRLVKKLTKNNSPLTTIQTVLDDYFKKTANAKTASGILNPAVDKGRIPKQPLPPSPIQIVTINGSFSTDVVAAAEPGKPAITKGSWIRYIHSQNTNGAGGATNVDARQDIPRVRRRSQEPSDQKDSARSSHHLQEE